MTTEITQEQCRERRYPILLVLAGLLAYWNSFGGTYFLDDHAWIVSNPHIGEFFSFFLSSRILIAWSLTLNYWIDGLNPRGYHAVNLAIHILAGLTLYGIIRRTLNLTYWSERVRGRSSILAFIVALIWLIHPLNTQAVTYVIQRCESMMGLFYLLTLYCMLRGATTMRGWPWYAAACLCCGAGVLCKEVMLTAPAVVLIFDWTFLSPSLRTMIRRRWAFYAVLGLPVVAFMTWAAATGMLTSKGAAVSLNYHAFGPLEYAMTQAGVILYYLRLSVCPWPLCFDYLDWPVARSLSDCWLSVAAIGLLLLAVLIGVIRRHWLGFLGAWFFLILAPSSSIMPIQDLAFEHRMYLSLAAVAALGVSVFYMLLDRATVRGRLSIAWARWTAILLVCLWGIFLSVLTMQRNALYCNFAALMNQTVATRPANYRALEVVAQIDYKSDKLDKALDELREVARLKPQYFTLYNTGGNCYLRLGRLKEAVGMFQTVLELQPNYQQDVYLASLGRALVLRGDSAEAADRLGQAIRVNPTNARYHLLRAVALDQSDRREEADAEYEQALRLDPSLAPALNRDVRAAVFDPKGNDVTYREAMLLAQGLCRMTHYQESEYLDTLSEAYAAAGRFDDAQEVCRKAADLAAAAGQDDLAQQINNRLEMYRKHRAYTQESASY